jgi:hypothetical protein
MDPNIVGSIFVNTNTNVSIFSKGLVELGMENGQCKWCGEGQERIDIIILLRKLPYSKIFRRARKHPMTLHWRGLGLNTGNPRVGISHTIPVP